MTALIALLLLLVSCATPAPIPAHVQLAERWTLHTQMSGVPVDIEEISSLEDCLLLAGKVEDCARVAAGDDHYVLEWACDGHGTTVQSRTEVTTR